MLIVPAGGLSPSIFEVMYWLAVVVKFICSLDWFSRISVKNMGCTPLYILGLMMYNGNNRDVGSLRKIGI